MGRYKIIFDGEEENEVFDSYKAAEDYALYLCSCKRSGAEILYWSNPGDYDGSFNEPEYEIIDLDEDEE